MWATILMPCGNSRLSLDHRDRGVPAPRILPPKHVQGAAVYAPQPRPEGLTGAAGAYPGTAGGRATSRRVTTPCTSLRGGQQLPRNSYLSVDAEGDPGSWFRLALGQHRGRYALPLRPDLNRSRERFTLARRLAELPTPDNVGYCHIYRPLHFVSGREHTYESFSRRLPNRVTAGLLDRAALDPAQLHQVDSGKVLWLGPFQVATDHPAKQFVRKLVERSNAWLLHSQLQ